MHDTKLALRRWNERPARSSAPGAVLSAADRRGLLLSPSTWWRSSARRTDARYLIPGRDNATRRFGDYVHVLFRNSLVLSLHALACVAGFMAGSSLPLSASQRSGSRQVGPREGGPARDRLRASAPRSSRSARRPTSSAARRSSLADPDSAPRPGQLLLALTPPRRAGAVRAVPSAGGLDDRQPPRRLARAAGGHGRDGRHRRAHRCWPPRRSRSGSRRSCCSNLALLNANGAARRPPRWLLPR